ncbi:hypothetical protein F4553_004289 [Allocatelliglobosispora scoriae]|uniref:Uncharacterized protein n=1 Tax=Allocatelliglobosispora scoriae TaxID=643052 RepID=A0A841BVY1_9ACTN|nr:hypothetical protein [Allocatelliglobosispora scoriae]MBB5870910.1 hypothetical protein [Allocatelliglobosispora scoriae]
MNRILRTLIPLTAAAALVVGGVAAPAIAAPEPNLTVAKAEVTKRIDLRLAALKKFDTALNAAKHITDGHRSTLHTLVTEDISGLTALKTKVAGETTREALRADAKSMVDDYRVFILVGPKVRLTAVSDAEVAAVAKLKAAHDKLADLVAKAKAAGKDTAAAEQDLAAMQAATDKASAGIDGDVATLLAIEPGPDGDAIRAKVGECRTSLKTARADLKTAVTAAKKVRAFLKSLKPSPAPAASPS